MTETATAEHGLIGDLQTAGMPCLARHDPMPHELVVRAARASATRSARRQATKPRSTPRALVALWAPALAGTLRLRRRSSPKTSPPSAVNATVAATVVALPPPVARATPGLAAARCSERSTCQRPNSTDVVTSTSHVRLCRASSPQGTERKAISSRTTVPRDHDERRDQRLGRGELVAAVLERRTGEGKQYRDQVDDGDRAEPQRHPAGACSGTSPSCAQLTPPRRANASSTPASTDPSHQGGQHVLAEIGAHQRGDDHRRDGGGG
jgi:hypothetical protein